MVEISDERAKAEQSLRYKIEKAYRCECDLKCELLLASYGADYQVRAKQKLHHEFLGALKEAREMYKVAQKKFSFMEPHNTYDKALKSLEKYAKTVHID